jgi:hypothetical protein
MSNLEKSRHEILVDSIHGIQAMIKRREGSLRQRKLWYVSAAGIHTAHDLRGFYAGQKMVAEIKKLNKIIDDIVSIL